MSTAMDGSHTSSTKTGRAFATSSAMAARYVAQPPSPPLTPILHSHGFLLGSVCLTLMFLPLESRLALHLQIQPQRQL